MYSLMLMVTLAIMVIDEDDDVTYNDHVYAVDDDAVMVIEEDDDSTYKTNECDDCEV